MGIVVVVVVAVVVVVVVVVVVAAGLCLFGGVVAVPIDMKWLGCDGGWCDVRVVFWEDAHTTFPPGFVFCCV